MWCGRRALRCGRRALWCGRRALRCGRRAVWCDRCAVRCGAAGVRCGAAGVRCLTVQFDDHGERHDEQRDEQVGDGERHEEVVGHVLQAPLPAHGDAHERVANNAGDDEDDESEHAPPEARRRGIRQRVPGRVVGRHHDDHHRAVVVVVVRRVVHRRRQRRRRQAAAASMTPSPVPLSARGLLPLSSPAPSSSREGGHLQTTACARGVARRCRRCQFARLILENAGRMQQRTRIVTWPTVTRNAPARVSGLLASSSVLTQRRQLAPCCTGRATIRNVIRYRYEAAAPPINRRVSRSCVAVCAAARPA